METGWNTEEERRVDDDHMEEDEITVDGRDGVEDHGLATYDGDVLVMKSASIKPEMAD